MSDGWQSWKPKHRGRPPGEWRQFRVAERVAGLKHMRAEILRFGAGASHAEKDRLDFGLDLQRQPENRHDKNAIMVRGHWTVQQKRWFRPPTKTVDRVHIGWIDRDTAAHLALAGPNFPIAAEFYEMAIANDPDPELGFGVIIKVIVLIPSFNNPLWGETSRIISGG